MDPVVLQNGWLRDSLLKSISNVPSERTLTSELLAKNVSPESLPVLRIFRFLQKTHLKDLTAILSDSTHKIYAVFPYEAIRAFELKYKKRITLQTVNSLILVERADYIFVGSQRLLQDYGVRSEAKGGSLIVLKVNQVEIFLRDQIELGWVVSSKLKFVYDTEYEKMVSCDKTPKRTRVKEEREGENQGEKKKVKRSDNKVLNKC